MNELEKYLLKNIVFDTHDDINADAFSEVLLDELDRLTIYTEDCMDIFNIAPNDILRLVERHSEEGEGYSIENRRHIDIETIVYRALQAVAFDFIYNKLKHLYLLELEQLETVQSINETGGAEVVLSAEGGELIYIGNDGRVCLLVDKEEADR